MPANLDVLNGEDFLQTGQRPLHSDVFTRELRRARMLPSTTDLDVGRRRDGRSLTQLFYQPVILPLQDRLEAIDEASVPLFDPSQGHPVGPAQPVVDALIGRLSPPSVAAGCRIASAMIGAMISICHSRAPSRASSSATAVLHVARRSPAASRGPGAGSRA